MKTPKLTTAIFPVIPEAIVALSKTKECLAIADNNTLELVALFMPPTSKSKSNDNWDVARLMSMAPQLLAALDKLYAKVSNHATETHDDDLLDLLEADNFEDQYLSLRAYIDGEKISDDPTKLFS